MPDHEFIDRLLRQDSLLKVLVPTDALDRELVRELKEITSDALASGAVVDAEMSGLVRGALFYALDTLPEAHANFQDAASDTGSYWHGMLHRREGDFDNARYWFRRAGTLPVFATIHRDASRVSELMARRTNWDPYLFTGQCEQARFGAEELVAELVALQRIEFDALLDYCRRKAVGG